MKIFVRIYERRSFTRAADDLNMPRATLTHSMNQFEAWLGTRLLERSTRRVRPTLDGEAYYQRCVHLLADLEEAELAFRQVAPQGRLRVDMHGTVARYFVIPVLAEFMARYPAIELLISESDRFVDLVGEGVDCVVRSGTLQDSALIGKRVALLPQVTCASAGYLRQHGHPHSLDALSAHRAVNYTSRATGKALPFEFTVAGQVVEVQVAGSLSVTGAQLYPAAALAGLGLIQLPRYRVAEALASGELEEVLAHMPPPPMPISVVYPHNRQMSPRVRVWVDWLAEIFARAAPAGA